MIAEVIQGCLSFAMSWIMMYCGLTWLANYGAILGKVMTKLVIVAMAMVCMLIVAAVDKSVGFFLGL